MALLFQVSLRAFSPFLHRPFRTHRGGPSTPRRGRPRGARRAGRGYPRRGELSPDRAVRLQRRDDDPRPTRHPGVVRPRSPARQPAHRVGGPPTQPRRGTLLQLDAPEHREVERERHVVVPRHDVEHRQALSLLREAERLVPAGHPRQPDPRSRRLRGELDPLLPEGNLRIVQGAQLRRVAGPGRHAAPHHERHDLAQVGTGECRLQRPRSGDPRRLRRLVRLADLCPGRPRPGWDRRRGLPLVRIWRRRRLPLDSLPGDERTLRRGGGAPAERGCPRHPQHGHEADDAGMADRGDGDQNRALVQLPLESLGRLVGRFLRRDELRPHRNARTGLSVGRGHGRVSRNR